MNFDIYRPTFPIKIVGYQLKFIVQKLKSLLALNVFFNTI